MFHFLVQIFYDNAAQVQDLHQKRRESKQRFRPLSSLVPSQSRSFGFEMNLECYETPCSQSLTLLCNCKQNQWEDLLDTFNTKYQECPYIESQFLSPIRYYLFRVRCLSFSFTPDFVINHIIIFFNQKLFKLILKIIYLLLYAYICFILILIVKFLNQMFYKKNVLLSCHWFE